MNQINMKKLLFLLLFFSSSLHACLCLDVPNSFCESIFRLNLFLDQYQGNCIAKMVVKEHIAHGIKVDVLEYLYGNETRDSLMIWGDWTGASCRGFVDYLQDNDTLVMAIIRGIDPNNSLEINGDYHLDGCGNYIVNIRNEQAIGFIDNDFVRDTIPYTQFTTKILDCYATSIDSPSLPLSNTLALFPNPCRDIAFFPFSEQVYVWNQAGTCVMYARQADQIDVAALPAGLYFVEHINGDHRSINKLVKW